MLQFKVNEILRATGKMNPASWLVKFCGLKRGKAQNIVNNTQDTINLKDLSKLCEALQCTPNDLLYWQNKPGSELLPAHPCLTQLKQPEELADWHDLFMRLPNTDLLMINHLAKQKMEGGPERPGAWKIV
jgi:DNA-binding Xre family transcriptional regulator